MMTRRQVLKLGAYGAVSRAFRSDCEQLRPSACAFMLERYRGSASERRALFDEVRDAGFRYVDLSLHEAPGGDGPFSPSFDEENLTGLTVGCVAL